MRIKCSICQRTIEVESGKETAAARCEFCEKMFSAKTAGRRSCENSEKIVTQCPHCQRQFKMYAAAIGRNIKCLNCGKEYIVEKFEAKEQAQPANQQINISESANAGFEEYYSEVERNENKRTVIIYAAVWLVLAVLTGLALINDIINRGELISPNMQKCIKCGKPATRTSQFGNDPSYGKWGPYIRKDYYDNCEDKRLCYVCRMRMAVKRQTYTLQINGKNKGILYMDVCRWCRPPNSKTLGKLDTNILEGPKIEINKWQSYPYCDKCVDFEWLNRDMLSTIPHKFILPVILLIGGLFAGVAGLWHKMKHEN